MNEKIKSIIKNPKMLIVLGVAGILLIFASSILPSNNEKKQNSPQLDSYNVNEYHLSLENDIKNIVTSITGDKNPTVVITLESGVKYSYASIAETDSSSATGANSDQSSESKKQTYITVKTADGGEKALIVAEIMPEVRGVAIICAGGGNEITAQKIKNAVTAALNITTKRVHISGGID